MGYKQLTGLLLATAYVVASDAPSSIREQAQILKAVYGDLIQICDGTTDNVEIQAAIDALPTGGGKVILSEGKFYISSRVYIRVSYTIIEGQGDATWLYLTNGANCPVIDTYPALVYFSHLRNFRVDANKAGNTLGSDEGAVRFNCWYGSVENLYVRDSSRYGIYCSRSGHTNIINNFLYGINSIGIFATNDSYGLISGNRLENCGIANESAIRVTSDKIVKGNTIVGGGYVCQIDCRQYAGSASERVLIEGNQLYNGLNMGIAYFKNSQILGNLISNIVNNAIDGDGNEGNIIADNSILVVTGVAGHGTGIGNITDSIIISNRIVSCAMPGIWVASTNDKLIIADNDIYECNAGGTYDAGILLVCNAGDYPSDIVISGNRIYGQKYGILQWTDGTTISNLTITDNDVMNNTTKGVYLPNPGTSVIVRSNQGYATENSGEATVPANNLFVTVTHSLAITPDINKIVLTPKDNIGARSLYPSNVGSSTFRINISLVDAGAAHLIGWSYAN